MTPSLIGNEDKPVDDQWNNINSKEKYQTMRLYYKIWVDFITRLRSIESNKNNWKIKSYVIMSITMTLNLILLMSILQRHILHSYFYKIYFYNFPILGNSILTILILFAFPCFVINYIFIFHKERYEKLLKKYSSYNGKLFLYYFLISIFLPIILLWGVVICQSWFITLYKKNHGTILSNLGGFYY